MKTTRTILITLAAAVTWFLPGHLAVLLLLAWVWVTSMAAAGNTAKVMGAETRVSALENQTAANSTTLTAHAALITTAQTTANTANSTANTANNAVNNLTGQQTSTAGLPDGTISGTSGDTNNNDVTSNQIGGAADHYHEMAHGHPGGSYAVANGQHSHTM